MNFYEDIAHRLYLQNTTIGPTRLQWKDFIEAMQDRAEFKGVTYYSNLISAMPNHFGANLYPEIFKETLKYCKEKIDEIQKPPGAPVVSTPSPDAGIEYLDEMIVGLFRTVEARIVKAEGSISALPKIRRAAFVEFIFEKKWLTDKTHRVKASNDFAYARYGEEVDIQLSTNKKNDRQTHKSQLKKYF